MIEPAFQSKGSKIHALSQPSSIRDIFIVGSPIVIMGVIGNLVGVEKLPGALIINLGYVAMIFVGAMLLKKQGSSWRKIGLGKPASWLKTLSLGVAAALGAVTLFVAAQGVAMGLLIVLGVPAPELDQSRFNPIAGNLFLYSLMIVLAWTTISFGEELFFRAFLITRMMDSAGMRPATAILIAGLVFGAVHFAEGPVGILANASFGVFFGWIFVRNARNLWITVISHGLINTLRFTLLFIGAA